MKNITLQVLAAFGVVLMVLLIIGILLFATDTYGVRTLFTGSSAPAHSSSASPSATGSDSAPEILTGTVTSASDGFELSAAQVEALVSLGIDPSAVPTTISAEQETCFVNQLGIDRVQEIKAGAVPSAWEFMQAESCL